MVLCCVVFCLIASIHIEQCILRRRAERLLTDIRSLQTHKTTFGDVQSFGQKWGKLTHWDQMCTAQSCGIEVLWVDFFNSKHLLDLPPNVQHWLILAGLRHQQVFADLQVENGTLTKGYFHVTVEAPGYWDTGQWWDYGLIGSAGWAPNILADRQIPPEHPPYAVTMPSGCEVCKAIGFVFDPSLDSATVSRLMQFDLSCLTRWIRPCRTEADIMPNAWAQVEADRAAAASRDAAK